MILIIKIFGSLVLFIVLGFFTILWTYFILKDH